MKAALFVEYDPLPAVALSGTLLLCPSSPEASGVSSEFNFLFWIHLCCQKNRGLSRGFEAGMCLDFQAPVENWEYIQSWLGITALTGQLQSFGLLMTVVVALRGKAESNGRLSQPLSPM